MNPAWLAGQLIFSMQFLAPRVERKIQTVAAVGCMAFRLDPFRQIDSLSNTTIGLKKRSGTTFRPKKVKDIRRNVAPLLFFCLFF